MTHPLALPVHLPVLPRKLAERTAVLVGVGGLGTEVARLLAQAGLGRIVLCDPDTVEESNLSRGALFGRDDVGRFKVTAAAAALRRIAPAIDVVERADDFRHGVGLGELRAADLVLSCLDSVADRVVLGSRCILSGNPSGLLDAGLHPWGGEVRHYTADGPCHACGCSPVDRSMPTWRTACGLPEQLGAPAAIVTLVAAWQALWAERLLLGEPLPATFVKIEPANGLCRMVEQPRDLRCPCHRVIDDGHVTRTDLTNRSTVGALQGLVMGGERVQSWNPIDRSDPLSPLSLRAADSGMTLEDLGIPPLEILPVLRVLPVRQARYLALREI